MCLQTACVNGFAEVPLTDKHVCQYRAAKEIHPRPVRFQACCKQCERTQETDGAEHCSYLLRYPGERGLCNEVSRGVSLVVLSGSE
jgi:hypothetical protein